MPRRMRSTATRRRPGRRTTTDGRQAREPPGTGEWLWRPSRPPRREHPCARRAAVSTGEDPGVLGRTHPLPPARGADTSLVAMPVIVASTARGADVAELDDARESLAYWES